MFSRFFIDRPIFATVLSIAITLAGGLALISLPLAMYPPIAPPTVIVTCQYPGASAQVVAETIASPIEQQVNGVENMMYMSSQCTNTGNYTLTVTFRHGVDMNLAQVLVQNRVSLANPLLPDVIKATGVTTKKQSPDILLAIGIYSPDHSRDQLYLSNYALIHVRDEICRLPGISDVTMFGQRDYSMRVWLDPDKLAVRGMTAGDVVRALREQNLQVAAGQVGQSPMLPGQQTQVTLSTLGRLFAPEQFERVIVKTSDDGRPVRIRDVGHVELGAKNEDMTSEVDGVPVANLGIFQLPDANALATADLVRAKIDELRKDFPTGVDYLIRYDTTPFVRESIWEVFVTLFLSVLLVAVVVLLFLQNWRSAIIPLVAVPVGIVGTFAVMLAMGFSLNNLTLFGLVLAIGIVVDDAIVVVECVEHHIEHGLTPRAATIRAMSEVSAPVVAVGMVLSAVFIPCAFISGITGQFFRQFALTIASSTLISTFNSLTLSPALAAILLKPRRKGAYQALPWPAFLALGGAAGYFWLGGYFLEQARNSAALARAAIGLDLLGALQRLGIEQSTAAGIAGALVGAFAGFVLRRPLNWVLGHAFELFNQGFQATANLYARLVGVLLRLFALVLLLYVGMLCVTYYGYSGFPKGLLQYARTHSWLAPAAGLVDKTPWAKGLAEFTGLPKGFIPSQDMGYLLVNIQLPDSASLERTKAVISEINAICHQTDGINATVGIAGQSLLLNAYGSNFGTMFITLKDFKNRHEPFVDRVFRWLALDKAREVSLRRRLHLPPEEPSLYFEAIANKLRAQFGMRINDANIAVFGPPPVRGVGRAGGFMIMIEDRGDLGPPALQDQVENLVQLGNNRDVTHGQLIGLTAVFRANVPQVFLDVNRSACMLKGVQLQDVFDTLQVYLGSLYVNDFNLFGRTWQVIAQADAKYRLHKEDIKRLRVRNSSGTMVPLGAVAEAREINGPLVLSRYNMYPAASINGSASPGVSTGTAIDLVSRLSTQELPKAMAYEWTELAYLELQAGNTAMYVFAFSIVMVFLVLAAQFESWSMPLAVILSVPLCMLSAFAGVWIAKLEINIFTQIGLVVLVGLASKNAILIVQFAKVIHQRTGQPIRESTLQACRLRLRPIVMTSMAFILGVIPLLFAHGAGAEMRRSLGMAVFSGMVGVTFFGVMLTPVFFYLIDTLSESRVFASSPVRRIGRIALVLLTLGVPWAVFRFAALAGARTSAARRARDPDMFDPDPEDKT